MKWVAYLLAAPFLVQFALAQPPGPAGRRAGFIRPEARAALVEAMTGADGEYAGLAFNRAVLERFGIVQPYAVVLEGKSRRINELAALFRRWEIALPANEHLNTKSAPNTLAEAARRAIAAEERSIVMYDRLLPRVKRYPEIARVFANAQRAGRDHHLPLLQAAAANAGQLTPAQMQELAMPRSAGRP